MIMKRTHARRLSTGTSEGPAAIHWSGFLFALAATGAVLGLSVESPEGDAARVLFFVFLVLGSGALLRCASHES
jgi:hypothetical protein